MRKEEFCEIFGDINEKHIAEARAERRAGKPAWLRWGAMAACLCLVVVGAFVVPGLQGKPGGAGVQPGGTPGTEVVQPGNTHETTQPPRTNLLVVNEVERVTGADMDVQFTYYNGLSESEQKTVMDAFESSIGLSYEEFMKKLPAAYQNTAFYSINAPVAPRSAEYIPHDYVFGFLTENGGNVEIATCSAEEPLRDCFFECDDPKESEINGTTAVIYAVQDSFMVRFACADVNYDIETHGITLEELENLLTGIINR